MRHQSTTFCDRCRPQIRSLAGIFLLSIALLAGPPVVTAADAAAARQAEGEAEQPSPELLLFQLRYESIILSNDLVAYAIGDKVLMPLGQLAQILEVGIEVDPTSGRATGVLPDNRSFGLKAEQQEVSIEGRRQTLEAEAIDLQPDDIYIDSQLVSQWLAVEFVINRAALLVELQPRGELPFQARIAREKARKTLAHSGAAPETPLPRIQQPARPWSVPFVDISTEFGYGRLPGAPAEGNARFSALAAGELLYMDTTGFLAGSDRDPLSSARLAFGRKDPEGGLLGPLGATAFAMGDIVTPRIGLIARSRPERGAIASNFPLEQATEFDQTTLMGDLPLGWEVELYRGHVLLDFRAADANGRFIFPDVPLLFGLNLFRLVYYGPQGQRREETRRIFVGPGLIAEGEHYYRATASQSGTSLFGLDDRDEATNKGDGRYSFEYATGLAGITVQSSLASLPIEGNRRTYASAGASAALGSVFGSLAAVGIDNGGWAAQAFAQTQLFGINVLAEAAIFSDFVSEREPVRLKNRARLRLDGALTIDPLPPLNYALDMRHELQESGESSVESSGRVSTRIGGVALSNTLAYTRRTNLLATSTDDVDFAAEEEFRGALLVSGRTGPLFLRGGVDYEVAPEPKLGATAVSAEWAIEHDFSTRLTLSHDWAGPLGSGAALDVSRRFENFSLGAYAAARTDGEYRVGLSTSFAFGQEPRTRRWNASPQAIAEYGAISAKVFLDHNLNGTFDSGDQALEGVEIRAEGTGKRMKTDPRGIAFITGIPAHTKSRIVLVPGTLEDPFMLPDREGAEVVLRPAERAVVDFPVVMTGEIDGTVQLRKDGQMTPGRNLLVQLLDPAGKVVKETRSGFDGFYLFDRIRPGSYRVRASMAKPDETQKSAEVIRDATIGPEGTVVNGLDLILPDRTPG